MSEIEDSLGRPIRIRRRRGLRNLRLVVAHDGQVTVTAPRLAPLFLIRRFLVNQEAWIADAQTRFREVGHVPRPGVAEARERFRVHREAALALVHRYLEILNAKEEWTYTTLTIRDQRTRWGSCSAQGALSFNYRLVFLSPRLAEYIVAHELCHLREHNHSPRFWALLETILPGASLRRQELRDHPLLESGTE
ncbi:MAG: M48 family metallopeptidase [Candidatus Moranbacteria bacterium]|nr:M48 family metallopeptidase [Candidatus Moranbacteria bacterium]